MDSLAFETKQAPSRLRKRAHLLMCGDAGYFQHIAVCLTSLAETNPETEFDAVVLVTGNTAECENKLRRSLMRYPLLNLRLVNFDGSRLSGLPLAGNYYPPEIYARFWIEDYFPAEVERVIYLDGDMVVVGPIDELLDLALGDNVLAAVSIPGSARASILGYDPGFEYFNSGMMVINLKRWREIGARATLIAATHAIADRLNDPDQDVLNYCFHAQRLKLDYTWNAITPFFRKVNNLAVPGNEIARVVRDARIVHFNGGSKPWQYLCFHPFKPVYLNYLARTEWRDFRPADYKLVNVIKKAIRYSLGERCTDAALRLLRACRVL
jgi:lipopolysaccharide biosynthesis glycosyltransferase